MKSILKILLKTTLALFLISIAVVVIYRFVPVPYTPLMLIRLIEEDIPIHHEWVAIDEISPDLVLAVVASEDNLFTKHNGFDIEAIKQARKEAEEGKRLRGASTISQQTAKNVFLWNGRSWLRKGLEAYFTVLIELIWGKERIMEAYLNSIEMGNGIYGAAAVAKYHFGKTPDKLTRSECALIAATLPNPRRFSSKKPSKYILKRQKDILANMKNIQKVNLGGKTDGQKK
ncbi:MAG: monofunctional biosynthetic peptidoglycan transglycosylase [Bacteroidaceae bacterium]|nr:monofunctional biosynthetic peptidoglycan transglycosylase [Bacteroidaceae bacterium]